MARVPSAPEYERLSDTATRTSLSIWTLRKMVSTGELPAYRMNNKRNGILLVKRAEVDARLVRYLPDSVSPEDRRPPPRRKAV